jgi:hypothetical protein
MKVIHENEIQNTCICTDENGEYTNDCYDCWEDQLSDFHYAVKEFFDSNPTFYFQIGGLKLWNREVSGIAKCETPLQLLNAMTVNSEWIMRYTVHENAIEYSLSHHDAPMGSASWVRHATEEQIEDSRW